MFEKFNGWDSESPFRDICNSPERILSTAVAATSISSVAALGTVYVSSAAYTSERSMAISKDDATSAAVGAGGIAVTKDTTADATSAYYHRELFLKSFHAQLEQQKQGILVR